MQTTGRTFSRPFRQNTAFFRKTLKDKSVAREISPDFLVRKGLPPTLAIHASGDGNVPYASAELFVAEMNKAGTPIAFHTIEGYNHFIWLDPRYSGEVNQLEKAFLKQLGYLN